MTTAMNVVHILDRRPGAEDAHGYAMLTLCGLWDFDKIRALNPWDGLTGVHWGERINGRWCRRCKAIRARPAGRVANR